MGPLKGKIGSNRIRLAIEEDFQLSAERITKVVVVVEISHTDKIQHQ